MYAIGCYTINSQHEVQHTTEATPIPPHQVSEAAKTTSEQVAKGKWQILKSGHCSLNWLLIFLHVICIK